MGLTRERSHKCGQWPGFERQECRRRWSHTILDRHWLGPVATWSANAIFKCTGLTYRTINVWLLVRMCTGLVYWSFERVTLRFPTAVFIPHLRNCGFGVSAVSEVYSRRVIRVAVAARSSHSSWYLTVGCARERWSPHAARSARAIRMHPHNGHSKKNLKCCWNVQKHAEFNIPTAGRLARTATWPASWSPRTRALIIIAKWRCNKQKDHK